MIKYLQWIRFFCVWIIIIFTIYSGYNYFYEPVGNKNVISNKITDNKNIVSNEIIGKHILNPMEKREIKRNFGKIDNNFSNNIVYTDNGIIIERVKK